MFKRKAYQKLLDWKKENGRTALLIEGARRVGKSTLAIEFAKNEYASYLLIDFAQTSREVLDIFKNQRTDIDEFFRYLLTFYGTRLKERDALVIFDEVQRFPIARSFIKHLVADGRYDYLETGSLISIRQNVKDILIPSEEERITLNPLDFEEFCWAVGNPVLPDAIRDSFDSKCPLPDGIHQKASRMWREYLLVGGMPQAVQSYLDTNDFGAVDRIKRGIINLYREDIMKFGESERSHAAAIFDNIPGQLAKHEKKFTLASMGTNARFRDYEGAFFWLRESGMVNICHLCNDPSVGLSLNLEENSLKCYMADTGLLVTYAFADRERTPDEVYRNILFDRLEVNEGMLVENAVAQQLKASGHRLFFYSKSSDIASDRMEIDFLIIREYDNAGFKPRVSPIEVKSTKRYGTSSLNKFKTKFAKRAGTEYVLHPRPMRVDEGRMYLPLYMAFCL